MLRSMMYLALVVLAASGTLAVNPLGRFGSCKNYPVATNFTTSDLEGFWYLQYRVANPDNYAHTCQAEYDYQAKYFRILLYYYSMGHSRNKPIILHFAPTGNPGIFSGQITVDGEAVTIFLNFIFVDKYSYRVLYICTDAQNANPDIDALFVHTRDQLPSRYVLDAGRTLALNTYYSVNRNSNRLLEFDKVVQDTDKCEPLTKSDLN